MNGIFWETAGKFFESGIFVYGTTLLITYALLATFSIIAVRAYARKEQSYQADPLLSSPLAPGITVLAPAYNEGLTIIYNVRSLMTLVYPKYEIIVINDGSTDNSLEQLIEAFELVAVDFAYNVKIPTQPVRRIYKSSNPAYSQLTIIDKVNGKSKADAVNAGINAASFDYFVCTDVDCILHEHTLIELIKPVLQEPKRRVIATGATLRIANSCEFDQGVMTRMRPPKQLLPRFQEVEYIRAFVLGKMGWSLINCVPNVSGGLGLFDKEVAIRSGGYDFSSFGEDMELMTRMCRYACDNGIDYAIRYVPRTLCWTEAPVTVRIFGRQRTRWARGLAQLMHAHFRMFLRPRYGRMGMVIFPYNFFFELLAPVVEVGGIIFYITGAILGWINWPTAILLLIFVYTYSVMITTLAILWDQLTFRYYKSWREVAYLCFTPFMEMFLYHPLIVFFSLRGYFFFLTGKKSSWGNMQRRGFQQRTPGAAPAN
ncbi:Glycosyltransferase, catalytic subunit of cellulose synthase and poly-beta-1,6-N-acetylglucosamine synthase [Chitinophaga terrae (ex Kim and Jung 2007)]|uniref:Glycosyltransferase, catalytic subunit of cellulose synthase and poly-beta-1,6-N-acetylglucosamine synthase n=1 Tax=Chitinophaga terrae (ex Kim and Jung 2007) TaxID=408074 RepID=A0A1H4D315_9BACT|nr:glycosyltransferase [Chitinophaga terrae (ex Kim and Jung 2007)]MDQ0108412.1 cellulose synthase/poly-beta-1,6-N-acetylglucosamine synthase-like glycosyltransferase [Chitinophaga terrae (ex Kim and Jung 2007)]GEP90582.1 glycosyl transferase family 2 [Chitinophaga terrae (ex Kim and Jung 2007)]SEA67104.1 Glycosyltransferase, catalytic subunit of cellulose synthase and poly-beta-1,6-N-acetylglucosamine synthase [Chitinophaga terrae (ex Kim and Jung 2007)]